MEKLWKFEWDCGRQGYIDGIFIADDKDVANIVGKGAYFGGVLGTHTEISCIIDEGHIKELLDNQEVIKVLKEHVGDNLGGYNPFDYIM